VARKIDSRLDSVIARIVDSDAGMAARELSGKIIDTVREPLLILDQDLKVLGANRSFYRDFRVEPDHTVGERVYNLGNGQWDIPALRTALERVLHDNDSFQDFEVEHDFQTIGRRIMLLNGHRVASLQLILLAIEDVTERREARRRLTVLNEWLEDQLRERVAALQVLHEITRAANEARSPEEAMAAALRCVCEKADWDVGHAWRLAGENSEYLTSTGLWHIRGKEDFMLLRTASAGVRLAPGKGFAGRVLAAGEPLHVTDLERFGDWGRGVASRLGVRAALGFPVTVEGESIAVLEFFRSEAMPPQPAFSESLSAIGLQLGRVIERQHLETLVSAESDRERQRLARELHDTLGQQVTALGMIATNLARYLDEEGSPRAATAARLVQGLDEAKSQVRALTKGLLPLEIDADGLMHALGDLVETAREGYRNIDFQLVCNEPVSLRNRFTATQLYRIAQEAIHNATTHASPASVTVSLRAEEGIELTVSDDGNGIPDSLPRGSGSGLRIMRHRADLIGGELLIESSPGRGTSVRCSAPRA
jgi:signal transduction histidine kinase